jgi:zinc/manganese transport system permease protein
VFVLAATAGVLLLTSNVHGSEHLRDLLVGQILWVQPKQLVVAALAYTAVLAVWFSAGRRIGRVGFYVLFACVVTLSVQLVGVYLVFATLIVPPLATRQRESGRLIRAWILGATGYVLGIGVSAAFDLPTGPLIVWTLVTASVVDYALTAKRRVMVPVR